MEHVGSTIPQINFGSVVMCVKGGSMASVSRSLLRGLSISSSINAHLAATKDRVLDIFYVKVWCWVSGSVIAPILDCS